MSHHEAHAPGGQTGPWRPASRAAFGSNRAIAGGIGFSVGIMLVISLLELFREASVAIGVRSTMTSFALGAGLVASALVYWALAALVLGAASGCSRGPAPPQAKWPGCPPAR